MNYDVDVWTSTTGRRWLWPTELGDHSRDLTVLVGLMTLTMGLMLAVSLALPSGSTTYTTQLEQQHEQWLQEEAESAEQAEVATSAG